MQQRAATGAIPLRHPAPSPRLRASAGWTSGRRGRTMWPGSSLRLGRRSSCGASFSRTGGSPTAAAAARRTCACTAGVSSNAREHRPSSRTSRNREVGDTVPSEPEGRVGGFTIIGTRTSRSGGAKSPETQPNRRTAANTAQIPATTDQPTAIDEPLDRFDRGPLRPRAGHRSPPASNDASFRRYFRIAARRRAAASSWTRRRRRRTAGPSCMRRGCSARPASACPRCSPPTSSRASCCSSDFGNTTYLSRLDRAVGAGAVPRRDAGPGDACRRRAAPGVFPDYSRELLTAS